MKFLLIISLLFTLLFSCKEDVPVERPEPKNLLSAEEMIKIMTDLTVVEAAYQMRYVQVSRYSHLMQKAADSIFLIHKTNRTNYESSFDYYTGDQLEMVKIYQAVKLNIENKIKDVPEESPENVDPIVEKATEQSNSAKPYLSEENLPNR